jgi:hypothetical protein
MRELYGSREGYKQKVKSYIDEMVAEGWILPEDRDVMFSCVRLTTSQTL